MILVLDNWNQAFYLSEVTNEQVVKKACPDHFKDMVNYCFQTKEGEEPPKYSTIIINLKNATDNAADIAEEMKRLRIAGNAQLIFFCIGMREQSEVVQELQKAGFYQFVLSTVAGKAKEQLQMAMAGYSTLGVEKQAEIEEKKEEEKVKVQENGLRPRTIAVMGVCSRIGTTTQALQIVKYLQTKGKKACYLSMTGVPLTEWKELFGGEETDKADVELSRIRVRGVDMFFDPAKILKIEAEGYQYIVYEYGSLSNTKQNSQTEAMSKDIRIVVAGIKPGETEGLEKVFSSMVGNATYYIFSFVPESEKQNVLKNQGSMAEKTVFAAYTPDPFQLNLKTPYEKVIRAVKEQKTDKKKFRLFGR
ncbi:MAG TPA: hypothetical protein DEP00_00095 [Lachnospiraceae bacterium]|nr:hypothetical protein [Lachnospiraceae bacterium]